MYKHYNMNQITLPLETEVLIPDHDISKAVHTLVVFSIHLYFSNSARGI